MYRLDDHIACAVAGITGAIKVHLFLPDSCCEAWSIFLLMIDIEISFSEIRCGSSI